MYLSLLYIIGLQSTDATIENGSIGISVELPLVLEQLASHIPDLVVYRAHNAPLPQTIHSYGVVMFADISGTHIKLAGPSSSVVSSSLLCHSSRLHGSV